MSRQSSDDSSLLSRISLRVNPPEIRWITFRWREPTTTCVVKSHRLRAVTGFSLFPTDPKRVLVSGFRLAPRDIHSDHCSRLASDFGIHSKVRAHTGRLNNMDVFFFDGNSSFGDVSRANQREPQQFVFFFLGVGFPMFPGRSLGIQCSFLGDLESCPRCPWAFRTPPPLLHWSRWVCNFWVSTGG